MPPIASRSASPTSTCAGSGSTSAAWEAVPFPPASRSVPGTPAAHPADSLTSTTRSQLAIGYAPGQLEHVFKGDITGVQASFPGGGMPAMTIVAHDYLHRLTEGKYSRGFGPLPDAVIAAILSAESFLLPAIDPTVLAGSTALAVVNFIFKRSGRKQKSQSDLDFLKEIAAAWDSDFWVEDDILYLARFLPASSPPASPCAGASRWWISPPR